MANHAYVIFKDGVLPSDEQIEQDLNEVLKRFPLFTASKKKDFWSVDGTENPDYIGLIFWKSDYKEYDEKYEHVVKTIPCLEFRHGHCCSMLWWLESEVRNHFGRKYNTYQVDDCDGIPTETPKEVCNSLYEYTIRGRDPNELTTSPYFPTKTLKEIIDECIQDEKDRLPEIYHPMLG